MDLPAYINGTAVETGEKLEVRYPWDNSLAGTAALIGPEHLEQAITNALAGHAEPLTRHERFTILRRAAELVAEHREELAALICRETGRTSDVLEFAAIEAIRDDGQVFSCDISPTESRARSSPRASR
jgi:aldehyde dehydrogenase (NAD+)